MRWARSYSIVDHQLLHGGFFQKLSHQALALYLFVVVVGDFEGKSYYADRAIQGILRLSAADLSVARDSLIAAGLITYRKPYWWVLNLARGLSKGRQIRRPAEHGGCLVPILIGDILRGITPKSKENTHD